MRRSSTVSLALMGVYLIGVGWWERYQQPLQRNRYASWDDCSCDYSAVQCTYNDQREVVGPWYLSDSSLRGRDTKDPGPGLGCGTRTGTGYNVRSGGGGGGGGLQTEARRAPIGLEEGYRAGFGGRARAGG